MPGRWTPWPGKSRATGPLSVMPTETLSLPSPQGGGRYRRRHWKGRIHSGRLSCYFPATPKRHSAEGGRGGNLFPPHLKAGGKPVSPASQTCFPRISLRLAYDEAIPVGIVERNLARRHVFRVTYLTDLHALPEQLLADAGDVVSLKIEEDGLALGIDRRRCQGDHQPGLAAA